MPNCIYKIHFTDGSIYNGGESLQDSKWADIPDKSIDCLVYFLDDHESINLYKFDKYAHFVEATHNVCGPKGTVLGLQLHFVYLMGLKNGKVTSYRISLKGERGQNRYIKGDITKRITDLGKEYKGKPIGSHVWK